MLEIFLKYFDIFSLILSLFFYIKAFYNSINESYKNYKDIKISEFSKDLKYYSVKCSLTIDKNTYLDLAIGNLFLCLTIFSRIFEVSSLSSDFLIAFLIFIFIFITICMATVVFCGAFIAFVVLGIKIIQRLSSR